MTVLETLIGSITAELASLFIDDKSVGTKTAEFPLQGKDHRNSKLIKVKILCQLQDSSSWMSITIAITIVITS